MTQITISVLWLILGSALIAGAGVGVYFIALSNGFKQGSECGEEALKIIRKEMDDQRETLIEFVLKMQDEYYNDRIAVCMKDCQGRMTGSELIDHKLALAGRRYYEKEEEVRRGRALKKLQDAKEEPKDIEPDKCHEEDCGDCVDCPAHPPLSLCQSCHSAPVCPERDDEKETCEGYMNNEPDELSTDNQQAVDTGARPSICAVCTYQDTCHNVNMRKSECNDFLHYDERALNEQKQAVADANVEAAESVKDYMPGDLSQVNDNPRRESTKKALEESIGMKKD